VAVEHRDMYQDCHDINSSHICCFVQNMVAVEPGDMCQDCHEDFKKFLFAELP